MLLLIPAYLGGVLTILSPCVLPVLPFVFSRADRPFARNGLPMMVGMALTFAVVATLAAVGGGWAVRANQYGRIVALAVLAVLGLTLLSDHVADWITRPLVALGNKLTERSESEDDSVHSAAGLGVATGLLWAPCAGPILGPLLTDATLKGANVDGATQWLNSPPLTAQSLRGKVVLVDFWTYSVCNQACCSYATCSLESAQ